MPKKYKYQRIHPSILQSKQYKTASSEDRAMIDEILKLQNIPTNNESDFIKKEIEIEKISKEFYDKKISLGRFNAKYRLIENKYSHITDQNIIDFIEKKDKTISTLVCKVPELLVGFDKVDKKDYCEF